VLAFARLYRLVDDNTTTDRLAKGLSDYWSHADAADTAWAAYLLGGGKQRRMVSALQLQQTACQVAQMPPWLWEQCVEHVGDAAEAAALVLPPSDGQGDHPPTLTDILEQMGPALQKAPHPAEGLAALWASLPPETYWVLHKLLTATLRAKVPQTLLAQTLATSPHNTQGLPWQVVAQRLPNLPTGGSKGDAVLWAPATSGELAVLPPSTLPLPLPPVSVDAPAQPLASYILLPWPDATQQALVVWRSGRLGLWLDGLHWLPGSWDGLREAATLWPDNTVLVCAAPTGPNGPLMMDVLQWAGQPVAHLPLAERLQLLTAATGAAIAWPFAYRNVAAGDTFDALWADMPPQTPMRLRRLAQPLTAPEPDLLLGPPPYTLRALLVYAERADGPADHYTTYTLALWQGDQPVTVTKAPATLPDADTQWLNQYIRANTLQRFGPVRTVKLGPVVQFSFDSLAPSARHKCGFVLRGVRLQALISADTPTLADHLTHLQDLLKADQEPVG